MVGWIAKPKTFADSMAYYGAHTAANMATRPGFRKAATIAATAAGAAYKYFSSKKNMPAVTPAYRKRKPATTPMSRAVKRKLADVFAAAKSKPKTRAKSGGTSRSGGKLTSKYRVRKGFSKGVKFVSERGGVLDTKQLAGSGPTVIVGHATCPGERLLNMIWEDIVRNLAIKSGMRVTDIDNDIYGVTGDEILIRYWIDRSNLATKSTYTYVQPASPGSISIVAGFLKDHWLGLGDQVQLDNIEFIPKGTAPASYYKRVDMPLQKAKVTVYTKSSLKMQNRSVEVAGDDDANDVDNVPLYGKSYEGPGSGMRSITFWGGNSFVCDDQFGDIWKQDTVSSTDLREPPPAAQFTNVKKFGKARVEPGQIKTSVLTYSRTILLDEILRILNQENLVANNQVYYNFGKFRVFVLEKMIQTLGSNDDLGIKLGYEVNSYHQVTFKPNYSTATILKTRVGFVNTTVQ